MPRPPLSLALRPAALLLALAAAACGQSSPQAPGDRVTGGAGSLPAVSSGHRPGPDILYAPAAIAPQLTNAGDWTAPPILVSGAIAYRGGEFLYQDFLYDDHGAAGVPDRNTPYGAGDHLFSPTAGTYTYPTDPVYAHNAADLVEFRVKPVAGATAFRVTLNTLLDPERVAFTVALGGAPGASVDWPHGAGVASPATHFLTVHGATAELRDAAGAVLAPAPSASVDLVRRQVDVRVPHAAWNPGSAKVRMTIGVGLWDGAAGAYLAPSTQSATATTPGGGTPTGVAIVNAGPRLHEPYPMVTEPVAPYTIGDSAAGSAVQAHWWRERRQADALRLGDLGAFYADVDFARLAARANDESGVPRVGPINRILASRFQFGQGLDLSQLCFDIGAGVDVGAACVGRFVGNLQPYALYIPDRPAPAAGWGLSLLLHSLSANYNQYSASRNQSQVGEQGAGYLVATPSGRGPDGFYAGYAEADTFEVWADVARHYPLDPGHVTVTGYSMGGFGTYRLLARYPDLFAAGFSVVAEPGAADPMLAGLRNTPLMMWNALADELVNVAGAEEAAQRMTELGLRHVYWLFPTADHLTLATNDEYLPGAEFIAAHAVDRDPPQVSFVVNPEQDNGAAMVVADHAYWVSDIRLRDAAAGPGSVEVRSEGFGLAPPEVLDATESAGALMGGAHGPMPYLERALAWAPAATAPKADVLRIVARNVASFTIAPRRARVSCRPQLAIDSDGPLAVTLEGC
jgi:hypothetical protein